MRATDRPAARQLVTVVVPAAPLRIGHDRLAADLVEGDRLRRLLGRRGDGDQAVRALRVGDGELQGLHAAHRAADRGQQLGDAELVEQQHLHVDHVGDRDDRERRAEGLARGRVDAGRTGRAVAAAQHVRADHEVAVGVERLARADQHVPPAQALVVGLVTAGDVGIARERVGDEHGVVAALVERAVGLVGDRDGAQRLTALERQHVGRNGDRREARGDEAGGTGLGIGDDRHVADLRGAARRRAQLSRVSFTCE